MSFRPRDTSDAAWAAQLEAWRRMGPSGRADVAATLSEELIELTRAGIRMRHPEYDDEAVRLAEIRQRLGDVLFAKAFPHAPRWDV